jgi:hypothetical protein
MSLTPSTGTQVTNPSVEEGLATLSGSSNDYTYNLAIQDDGSATGAICYKKHAMVQRWDFPAGTFDTNKLRSLLTKIGDVSEIPAVSTEISYAGKSSGNLRSIWQQASGGDQSLLQASNDLANYLLPTLNKLKIT